jgi:hypothetical protein
MGSAVRVDIDEKCICKEDLTVLWPNVSTPRLQCNRSSMRKMRCCSSLFSFQRRYLMYDIRAATRTSLHS